MINLWNVLYAFNIKGSRISVQKVDLLYAFLQKKRIENKNFLHYRKVTSWFRQGHTNDSASKFIKDLHLSKQKINHVTGSLVIIFRFTVNVKHIFHGLWFNAKRQVSYMALVIISSLIKTWFENQDIFQIWAYL